MKTTRIFIEAYPISESRISGIGHMTLELIRALENHPENGKSFKIILVIPFDRKEMLKRWNFKTVEFKSIPIPVRVFNILWKFDLLPPMDLFLGKGTYLFPNYKNWRLARSKNLTFVCDISYLLVPEFVSPKNQQFLEKNINKWVRRSDKVLSISENARQEIIENLHIDAADVLLIPCGVDKSYFYKKSTKDINAFLTKFDLPEDYVLYLGNIEPRKNISRLLEAYKLMPAKLRDAHPLVLVGGGGWLNEPILEQITDMQKAGINIIRPSKYVTDECLPDLYSAAAILAHPALYEGFGISPLQALACELPVVVANNSSLPEVVGDAGLYVDAENVDDISAKMERLLNDRTLRNQLILKGKAQSDKYSWKKSADILITEIGTN